jgi:hypothetical protein
MIKDKIINYCKHCGKLFISYGKRLDICVDFDMDIREEK